MAGILVALLGCTAKQPGRCDPHKVDELVAGLDAADPHARGRIVVEGLDEACELEVLYNLGDHDPGLTDAGEEAFGRACLAGLELAHTLARDQHDAFYVACGLGRLGVVSPSEYRLQPGVQEAPWAIHQWLLDQGLRGTQVRPITRALLLRERAQAARVKVSEDLRLPTLAGEREFEARVRGLARRGLREPRDDPRLQSIQPLPRADR